MAIIRAIASGLWSDPATWFGGVLPTSADTAWSNTFTVQVDGTYTVLSLSNNSTTGVTAGGKFVLNNGANLTCTATPGLNMSGSFVPLLELSGTAGARVASNFGSGAVGGIFANSSTGLLTVDIPLLWASSTPANTTAIKNTGNCNVVLTGSIQGVSNNNALGIECLSGGSVTVRGSVTGGDYSGSHAIVNSGSASITVIGTASGASGNNAPVAGIVNSGSGNVTVGSVVGGASPAIQNTGTGLVTVLGNCTGGSVANVPGLSNSSQGRFRVEGNVAGATAAGAHGISNTSANVTASEIVGNCTGGSGSAAYGLLQSSTNRVNITGTAIGGSGTDAYGVMNNSSTGTVSVEAAAICASGVAAAGAVNNSSGTLLVNGPVVASNTSGGVIRGSHQQTTRLKGPLTSNANGMQAVSALRWEWDDSTPSLSTQVRRLNGSMASLYYIANPAVHLPSPANVRAGVSYGLLNELLGTCQVPDAQYVLPGVPVGGGVGSASLGSAASSGGGLTRVGGSRI